MSDDPIGDAVRRQMAQRMDDMIMKTMMGSTYTNAVAEPQKPFDIESAFKEWSQLMRNWKRENVTVVVDLGHDGPITIHETATDGKRVEANWPQACAIHKVWPMKLHQVNSPEQAEFVPISGVFNEFVPLNLEPPPWQVLDDIVDETSPEKT